MKFIKSSGFIINNSRAFIYWFKRNRQRIDGYRLRSINAKINPTVHFHRTVGLKFNIYHFFSFEYKLSGSSIDQGIYFSNKFMSLHSESLSNKYTKYLSTAKPLALAVSTIL